MNASKSVTYNTNNKSLNSSAEMSKILKKNTNENIVLADELDKEFAQLMMEIEDQCQDFNKKDLLLIDSWCKKFCEITTKREWKKNRNLHAIFLLDMILQRKLVEPYDKYPKFDSLPVLNKTIVKSKLKMVLNINLEKHKVNFEKVYQSNNINNNKENKAYSEFLIYKPVFKKILPYNNLIHNQNEINQRSNNSFNENIIVSNRSSPNKTSKYKQNNFTNRPNSNTFNSNSGKINTNNSLSMRSNVSENAKNSKKPYKSIPIHIKNKEQSKIDKEKMIMYYKKLIIELSQEYDYKKEVINENNNEINNLNLELLSKRNQLERLLYSSYEKQPNHSLYN